MSMTDQPLSVLAMSRGGLVGGMAGAMGGLLAALLFGAFGSFGSSPRQGFWQEMTGALLCFGVPMFCFGWVIGYAAGALGGLVGGYFVAQKKLGRAAPWLGAAVGFLAAIGVESLLTLANLLDWRYDWFILVAAACTPVGSGLGGWLGSRLALRSRTTNAASR
jgi:hypothetical protein